MNRFIFFPLLAAVSLVFVVSAQTVIRERISIDPRVAPQGSLQETSDILLETDCDVTISAVSRFAAFPVTYFEINALVIVNNSPTRYSELQLPPPYTAVMPAGTVLETGSLTLTALVSYDRNAQNPDILENMQFVTWKLVRWSDAINPFDGRVRGLTFVMEANPNGNWWVNIGLVSRLDYFTVEVNPNILEASEETSLVVEGKAKGGSTVGLANGKRISLRTDFGLELVTDDQIGRNLDVPWSAVQDVKVRAAIVLGTGEFSSSVSARTMWWGSVSGFGALTTNPPVVTVRRTAPKPELRFEPVENIPYGGERFVAVTTVNQLGQPMAIPGAVTYTIALGEGRAWGILGRGTARGIPLADTITKVFQFNDLPRAGGKGGVMFNAWEAEPDDFANIAIHAWASDPTIKSVSKGLVVVPSPLAVTVTPATLGYGGSALIDIRKKQADGTTTALPSGTSFLYEIVQLLQAGRLQSIDSTRNGDEVFDTEPQFRFLAIEESPQPDSVQVWITIKAWQPGTTKPLEGMAKIVVKRESILKIVEHAPWAVWPHLPPQSNGRSRGSDRPGYDPKRSFKIEVLDGSGQPLADEIVQIRAEFVPLTGGHEHSSPALPQNGQGTFFAQGESSNPLVGLVTDAEGIVLIDSLVASQVAGRYLVTASLASDSTVRDTVQLTVRVLDFVDFSQINTHIWTLVGAIPGKHTDNHWCTQKMLDSLVAAVVDFYSWSGSEENEGRFIVLAVNDMSLRWGGVFDIDGQWNLNSEHSFHRIGLSVDINNVGFNLKMQDPKKPNNPKARILTYRGRKLVERMGWYGGRLYDEPQIHFGFDGGH